MAERRGFEPLERVETVAISILKVDIIAVFDPNAVVKFDPRRLRKLNYVLGQNSRIRADKMRRREDDQCATIS
jgi:hypothetical protein